MSQEKKNEQAQNEQINEQIDLTELAVQTEQAAEEAPTEGKERKNRFQVSREIQEQFVNTVAERMLSLAENAGKWKRGWTENQPAIGLPFCPTTGREYSGGNLGMLMLTSMMLGYNDDRWLTYKQMEAIREKNPDLKMHIRKGEKGTKILRPEQAHIIIDEETGRWKFLNKQEIKEIQEMKDRGEEVPKVHQKMLFYPFTVFNASQIEGFPPKEKHVPKLSPVERNEMVERFIASSGVAVDHYEGTPVYIHGENLVKLPYPDNFTGTDEYYAAKLHEFFHATGHESRENRLKPNSDTKAYAFEEMRAELFSMMAGSYLDLPMPDANSAAYIKHWNQKFSGGDAKDLFRATSEASKMLVVLHQYAQGEKPAPSWFPKQEEWPALIQMQKERDAACGATFKGEPSVQPAPGEKVARPAPDPEQFVVNFKDASDFTVQQFEMLLDRPDFLDKMREAGPEAAKRVASKMDTMSMATSMEADEQLKAVAKEIEPENTAPRATTSFRMR